MGSPSQSEFRVATGRSCRCQRLPVGKGLRKLGGMEGELRVARWDTGTQPCPSSTVSRRSIRHTEHGWVPSTKTATVSNPKDPKRVSPNGCAPRLFCMLVAGPVMPVGTDGT